MEIIKYLNEVKEYLYGDLENYKKICNEVKTKEKLQLNVKTPITASSENAPSGKSSTDIPPISTSTTTPTTTAFPGSNQGHPKYFRSTIPHVLSLFATIDFVGFLQSDRKVAPNTIDNIKDFFTDCKEITEEEIRILAIFFRNGHSHQYFAKYGFGISDSNPDFKNRNLFYLDSKENITLNVEILIELTKRQFDQILKIYNNGDEPLLKKAEEQYIKIIEENNEKKKKLSSDLDSVKYKNKLGS